MKYAPIFEKDGQDFIVPSEDMVGDSENEAWTIAMGTVLVEGTLLGFKATNRYLELDDNGKVDVTGWHAKLGSWDIVILDTAESSPSTGKAS
ncbi:hypothetical protein LCGC14_2309840 [marine sediment metagenome]|uniref:Uncharacterized protein n=1 Tax=marine sediment metagenome TaxID=412755 RepID=A0A0F9CLH0_9ZZZZ